MSKPSPDDGFSRYRDAIVERFRLRDSRAIPVETRVLRKESSAGGGGAAGSASTELVNAGVAAVQSGSTRTAAAELEQARRELAKSRESEAKLGKECEQLRANVEEIKRVCRKELDEIRAKTAEARATSDAATEREAAAIVDRRLATWGLTRIRDAFAARCGLASRVEDFASALEGIEQMAATRRSRLAGTPADQRVSEDWERALRLAVWVLSCEFYALVGNLRAQLKASGAEVALTSAEVNSSSSALARAINDRIFEGRTVAESSAEIVRPNDAIHSFASDIGPSDDVMVTSFLVRDASGGIARKATLVRARKEHR